MAARQDHHMDTKTNKEEKEMKRLILALTIAAMGLFYSGAAGAFTQTTTGSMNIAATMLPRCTVTTAPMNFPAYDGTVTQYATSTITVNCTDGTPYRIDIDWGLNADPISTFPRRVKTGTATASQYNTSNYSLFKDATHIDLWGDNGATFCIGCAVVPTGKAATGMGVDQPHTVFGALYATNNPPGTYTDTVVVTVNY